MGTYKSFCFNYCPPAPPFHYPGGCGNIGHVTKIEGWNDETYRSVANVLWTGDFRSNVYRRAHRGKVKEGGRDDGGRGEGGGRE